MAAKKNTRNSGAGRKRSRARAPKANLRIRMYRQGLGDCFLITAPSSSGKPFHVLIDCGVVLGTQDPAMQMARVVNNIAKVTNGHIDLLVITHEHWDHLSAFVQVPALFDKINIEEVWLAWTEDPKDKLASKLRKERRRAEKALRMAVNHLAYSGESRTAAHVESLVGFFGAKAGSTEDALNYVKKRAGGNLRYCQPGEPPIAIPELRDVRVWVLGPPKDERLIKKPNPNKNDAYGLDAGPRGSQSLLLSALTRGLDLAEVDGSPMEEATEEPFETAFSIPMSRSEHIPFFEKNYYGDSADGSLYEKKAASDFHDQSWRRIDSTWAGAAETLALQLDSATNNTSLVLAFEIIDTGDILLFPGDAQAGNWLSWQDLKWELENPKSSKKTLVTGPDLLARTVFYKVGHHGSHNATLKAQGLELMLRDDLIAMIPVDHAMAVKKHWGRMPLADLVDRIREKTHGRVLRIDDKVKTAADLLALRPDHVDSKEWKQFIDRLDVTDLYYELAL